MYELRRFLHPGSQSFYGSGAHRTSTRPDENVQSVLQSICTTLCDMQSQLSAIKQQNDDRDVALKELVQEVYRCRILSSVFNVAFTFLDRRP